MQYCGTAAAETIAMHANTIIAYMMREVLHRCSNDFPAERQLKKSAIFVYMMQEEQYFCIASAANAAIAIKNRNTIEQNLEEDCEVAADRSRSQHCICIKDLCIKCILKYEHIKQRRQKPQQRSGRKYCH